MITTIRIAMMSAEPRSSAPVRADAGPPCTAAPDTGRLIGCSPVNVILDPPAGGSGSRARLPASSRLLHVRLPARDHRSRQLQARRRPGSLDEPLVEVEPRRA